MGNPPISVSLRLTIPSSIPVPASSSEVYTRFWIVAMAMEQDIYWMCRALELAARGTAVSSPNPAVGCVVLDRAGQVAGEGWHEYDLVDHAEVVALKEAKEHAGERL